MVSCNSCRTAKVKCCRVPANAPRCRRCTTRDSECSPSRPENSDVRATSLKRPLPPSPSTITPNQEQRGERRINQIKIGFDVGSSYTKCSYHIRYNDDEKPNLPALRDDKFLCSNVEDIVWPDRRWQCRTQLAFQSNPGELISSTPLWGDEVDGALRNGEISESDVLRYLKPQLYGEAASSKWHDGLLLRKIRDWPITYESSSSSTSLSDEDVEDEEKKLSQAETDQRTIRKLWQIYLQCAFLYVVNEIRKTLPSQLDWAPLPQGMDEYDKLTENIFGSCDVQTAITMPAGASVEYVQLGLEIAKAAGIPNCYPVAEPSAAAAFVMQRDFERSKRLPDQKTCLIVDLGGGTLDVISFRLKIDNVSSPLHGTEQVVTLQELMPGKTKWCGAAFVNKEFRSMLAREIDIQYIVSELNRTQTQPNWTEDAFLSMCESLFEIEKRGFSPQVIRGGKYMNLHFPGLQLPAQLSRDTGNVRLSGGRMQLKPKWVEKAFDHCSAGVTELISQQLAHLSVKREVNGNSELSVDESVRDIYFVGGGSASPLIRAHVHNEFNDPDGKRLGCKVTVAQLSTLPEAPCIMARGALVLLTDKDFIGERVIRRGYCFTVEDILAPGEQCDEDRLVVDRVDGCKRKGDSARWLLRVGDRVQGKVIKFIRGERHLYTNVFDRTEEGWPIDETLWASDRRADNINGIWVCAPYRETFQVGRIRFLLEEKDVAHVRKRTDLDGEEYRMVQYESGLVLEGYSLRWYLSIPRSGSFADLSRGSIQKEGKIVDCVGNFQLFSAANQR